MARYEVLVTRTEYISFELEAASAEDAERRYLMEGDETASRTGELTVTEVRPLA